MTPADDTARILRDARDSAEQLRTWATAIEGDIILYELADKGVRAAILGGACNALERAANEVARLKAERDAKLGRPTEMLMAIFRRALAPPVDHPVLDLIAERIASAFLHGVLGGDPGVATDVVRKSEGLEFRDPHQDGRRFEIVVRPIDSDEEQP